MQLSGNADAKRFVAEEYAISRQCRFIYLLRQRPILFLGSTIDSEATPARGIFKLVWGLQFFNYSKTCSASFVLESPQRHSKRCSTPPLLEYLRDLLFRVLFALLTHLICLSL